MLRKSLKTSQFPEKPRQRDQLTGAIPNQVRNNSQTSCFASGQNPGRLSPGDIWILIQTSLVLVFKVGELHLNHAAELLPLSKM